MRRAISGANYDLPYTEWGLRSGAYDPVKNGDLCAAVCHSNVAQHQFAPRPQIIQNPDALAFLWEAEHVVHLGATNPNFKWPADLPESWTVCRAGCH